MNIGERIKLLRKQAGLTQEALARCADMSLNGIASIERGKRLDPHLSTLKAIASALGISVSQLLEEE